MAARFLVAGGGGNWNSNTNWASSSGGTPGASFPTVADDVTFDTNSGSVNITVNVSSAALTLTITSGYTGVITMTNQLAISGAITLGANMGNATGSGSLIVNSSATLTSNGKTWTASLNLQGTAQTYTLADNWTVSNFSVGATTSCTLNGNQLSTTGLYSINVASITGTTNIFLIGTGNWQGAGSTSNNLTINTAGTITLNANVFYKTGTLTYTSGTVVSSGFILTINGNCTLNTSGITWSNISVVAPTTTITLNSTLRVNTFAYTGISGTNTLNGTAGFDVDIFTSTGVSRLYVFKIGVTYRIRNTFTFTGGASASHTSISSSTPSTNTILTLDFGSTQDLGFVNATDVDSSAGQTIWSYKGTLSNTSNWQLLPTQPKTIATSYC